tara:strand:- start:291 stop:593 length:303 start_codon:yes stop_codon:yes gene_type:complete
LPAYVKLERFEDPLSISIGSRLALTRSNELVNSIAVEKIDDSSFKVYVNPIGTNPRFDKVLKKFQREYWPIGPRGGIWVEITDFDQESVQVQLSGYWIDF